MSESRLAAGLEVTARAVAVFVAVIYGAGFLVVAIHHAQYGIAQFDPLKPKIFSTGIVFMLLVALPTIAAFRIFHIFELRGDPAFGITCKPENRGYLTTAIGISFFVTAFGLTNIATFLFESFDSPKPWGLTCLLVIGGLYITLSIIERKYFDRHPALLTFGDFLLTLLLVLVWYRFFDHRELFLNIWFFGIGIGAVVLSKSLQSKNAKQVQWERQLPLISLVFLTYSTLIYGHIKPSFGGGAPIPAMLYFTGRTPVGSDSADVLLLEETDHGYYILPNVNEKSAYFIRRDLVSAIHFHKKD